MVIQIVFLTLCCARENFIIPSFHSLMGIYKSAFFKNQYQEKSDSNLINDLMIRNWNKRFNDHVLD